jgi:ribA/ribD-fused uncharacterized protein
MGRKAKAKPEASKPMALEKSRGAESNSDKNSTSKLVHSNLIDGRPLICFYGHGHDALFREFSNFYIHSHPFEFILPDFAQRANFPKSVWCEFSEKAIMCTKAALMNDRETFLEIERAEKQAKAKSLGRQVKNFDEKLWQHYLEDLAFEVEKQKFASAKFLRELLLSTGDAVLVEAAPNDRIWGIGLKGSDERVIDQSQWQGRNVLGYALMRAREYLRRASGVGECHAGTLSSTLPAVIAPSNEAGGKDSETNKDVMKIRKKLREIDKLKQLPAAELDVAQKRKLESEPGLLARLQEFGDTEQDVASPALDPIPCATTKDAQNGDSKDGHEEAARITAAAQSMSEEDIMAMQSCQGDNILALGARAAAWISQREGAGTHIVERLSKDATGDQKKYYAWCLRAKQLLEAQQAMDGATARLLSDATELKDCGKHQAGKSRWARSHKQLSTASDDKAAEAVAKATADSSHSVPTKPKVVDLPSGPHHLFAPEKVARFTVRMDDVETALRPVLDEYGCAIVTDVATHEDCAQLQQLFAEDLGALIDASALQKAAPAVRRAFEKMGTDVSQWPEECMSLLGDLNRCQLRGLPHGRFAWGGRLHSNVRRCYEVIHNTRDLVSSCDNSFFAPASQPQAHQNRAWPHVDQNQNDQRIFDDEGLPVGDWEVFQGILYIWSSENPHASTTVVLPGSHGALYDSMMKDPSLIGPGRKGNHFTQVSSLSQKDLQDSIQAQWQAEAGRVPVPSGGLFIWSSRTLHQGWKGGPRLAQPVCWEPVGRRDEAALERKLRLAALGLPSTHWASLGTPHTLVKPQACQAIAATSAGGKVSFPMKRSIHPVTLREEVDINEMWKKLQCYDWNSPLPADLRELLEAALTEDIRQVL